jgi:hypothetical protein
VRRAFAVEDRPHTALPKLRDWRASSKRCRARR